MRQTVADPESNEEEWKIYDNFDITLKYECDDDILTLGTSSPYSPTDIPFQEYQIGSGL